jgi:putative ABC transport system substrate-binding protein
LLPNLKLIAILGNVDNPHIVLEMREVEGAAQRMGVEVAALEVRRADEIASALEKQKAHAQALYVCTDALTTLNRVSINRLALDAGLPTIHDVRDLAAAGGLMSYGPNWSDQFRRAAELADKVLRGVKPADIPVEQADKFELVINLKTANALGLTVSPALLARADEVIE